MRYAFALVCFVLTCWFSPSVTKDASLVTVSKHGQLSVKGTSLYDKNGDKIQLKGMSLFWDVWRPQFYNKASIDGIYNSCHGNVVRAALAVKTDDGGYIGTPDKTLERLYAVVDAAIKDDIYVIIDWHDYEADQHRNYSLEFFNIVSKKYSGVPNIIYETFNEPRQQTWNGTIRPYHEAVIKTIRANDPNNVIVVGTPSWSQDVDIAATNPITDYKNIMYTLHFYAGTHKQWLRDKAEVALGKGLPLFVTEYGTVFANASSPVDEAESRLWWKWLDQHYISYVNWAISDKAEGASALIPNTTSDHVCQEKYLTASGKLVVSQNKA